MTIRWSKLLVPWLFFPFALIAQTKRDNTIPVTVSQMAKQFKSPPSEYGPTVTWGWNGYIDSTIINQNLDQIQHNGFKMVTIEAGYNLPYAYLSSRYFKLVKYAVYAAKERGMRVWFIDESKYPSGFAGGLFSQKRPDLRMQALIPVMSFNVKAGQTINRKIPSSILSAIAYHASYNTSIPIHKGEIHWKAPKEFGNWKLLLVGHDFRTSPTMSSNNPARTKNTTNSLCDYLNSNATLQFIQFTHEQYKRYVGSEFGKTIIGFRSDEPAFSHTPWTPNMLKEFQQQKGYNIQPYLASFFIPHPTKKEQLARADYFEVFSNLFRDHFFKVISDWCLKNHIEYEDHIDHDGPEDVKTMMALVRSEGDYFRDMRYLQIPGIDVIWNQIWPGNATNFPKLASSAAHLYGRSQVFSESFAAFHPKPNIKQLNWVLNEQLARGVNLFEIMYYSSSRQKMTGYNFMASDSFPNVMCTLSRKSYILAQGQPTTQIGLYFPTSSLWLGDTLAAKSVWNIANTLLKKQRDFDFVDQQAIDSSMQLRNGYFINRSGQVYHTIILPSISTISSIELHRLHTFANEGGKVIFMGSMPLTIETSSFLKASSPSPCSWAIKEPSGKFTRKVLNALPVPDVVFNKPCPSIKYIHRHLKDGDVYFFFNESDKRLARATTIEGNGVVQVWNPDNGKIIPVGSTYIGNGFAKIPLDMAPYEARVVVLGALPKKYMSEYYRLHQHPRFVNYFRAESILSELIDNVSKNGSLLLNISPRGNGIIPLEQQNILLDISHLASCKCRSNLRHTPMVTIRRRNISRCGRKTELLLLYRT